MNKKTIIILLTVSVLIVIYFAYNLNRPVFVLKGLSDTEPNLVIFSWMETENNSIYESRINGQEIEINNIGKEEYNEIKEYFEKSGFSSKESNQSLGTKVRLSGYQKGNLVCSVVQASSFDGQCFSSILAEVPDQRDIKVKCGLLGPEKNKAGEILPEQVLEVEGEFTISLPVNFSNGYRWQPYFDSEILEVYDAKYQPALPNLAGAGGDLTFYIKPLKSAETEITFSYMKPYDERPPVKKAGYKIIVK